MTPTELCDLARDKAAQMFSNAVGSKWPSVWKKLESTVRDNDSDVLPYVDLTVKLRVYRVDDTIQLTDLATRIARKDTETDSEFDSVTIDPNQPELLEA